MSETKKTVDYYGTFLDASRSSAPGNIQMAGVPAPPANQAVVDQVLIALRSASPLSIKDLMPVAGYSFGALMGIVNSLQSMGLVVMTANGDYLELTPKGSEIANLVQPPAV